MEKLLYSIIEVSGGIGKNIIATAVISAIKKKYPDRNVLVLTAFPEVFLNNVDVYRVFRFGSCPYFYDDYVKGNDVLFFCAEPYRSNGYLRQSKHLIESWCEELGVPVNLDMKLCLNSRELDIARSKIGVSKPILVYQPFGGPSNMAYNYCWNRDIPPRQAQEIANILCEKYHIVQPISGNIIRLNNCEHANLPLRDLFCLLYFSSAVLGIDSCIQHAARAMNRHATVCWITNSPVVFGYDSHTNIIPMQSSYIENKQQVIDGYFHEYDFTGARSYEYPFKNDNIFDIMEVIEEFQEKPV